MNDNKADKIHAINQKFQGFTNTNFNDDGGAKKGAKIKKAVDKKLSELESDIELAKEAEPKRRKTASYAPVPDKLPPPPKRQKTASKPATGSKKNATAAEMAVLLDQYNKYLSFCKRHKIAISDTVKGHTGASKKEDLVAALKTIEFTLDSRDADGMVQTQCVMAMTAIEKIVMQPPIYNVHRLKLNGLAAAVDRSWDELFAEIGEEFAIKYNLFFKAPVEARFLLKIGMVAKALHEYNSGGPQFREGVDAGDVLISTSDFPTFPTKQ